MFNQPSIAIAIAGTLPSLVASTGWALRAERGLAACLALVLDEIDHGLVLLDARGAVRLLNHRARQELGARHPLLLEATQLRARTRADDAALSDAITASAQHGRRCLLALGDAAQRVDVAVVPLGPDVLEGEPATLLLLSKRMVCESLAVQAFARSHKLTPAESRVLEALCADVPPAQIATRQGVRISTVRTQIGCLREKTGARSIHALVHMVAMLPPMVPALRGGAAVQGRGTSFDDAPMRPS